jgi:hypothetical protein
MKKVICAAAAFMMVAGVATVASAEVNLSGDARARLTYLDSGVAGLDNTDTWSSRVRFVVKATTESGAFAKARIRMADATWDGTTQTQAIDSGVEKTNIYVDWASVGIKMGKVTVEGGLQNDSFSDWYSMDNRADRLKVKLDLANGFIAGTYDKAIETTTAVPADTAADNDKNVYGISYKGKFADSFTLMTRLAYVDDSTVDDLSGFKGSVNGEMALAGGSIFAEMSYKDGGIFSATADDQYGGYAQWAGTFGNIAPTVSVGFTEGGFTADDDYGFIMIGSGSAITQIDQIGQGGDTVFLGLASDYAASEKLSFGGNLVLMDVDTVGTTDGENPYEVSGYAKYLVGAGADVKAVAGYFDADTAADDAVLGFAVTMNVAF